MTKMLNSENLLADSGLDPHSTAFTADRILYNHAIEQCQAAALDELFGNPEECFQVINANFNFSKINQETQFYFADTNQFNYANYTIWQLIRTADL